MARESEQFPKLLGGQPGRASDIPHGVCVDGGMPRYLDHHHAVGESDVFALAHDAEAAFLGAVLIDNRVIEELQVPIRPDHFFEPLHQRIYERVLTLIERNATASPVTLRPFFEADEALKDLGGTSYLAQLTANGAGLLLPRELSQQIYDLALLRQRCSWCNAPAVRQ